MQTRCHEVIYNLIVYLLDRKYENYGVKQFSIPLTIWSIFLQSTDEICGRIIGKVLKPIHFQFFKKLSMQSNNGKMQNYLTE